jgi:hypothetical protein
MEVIGKDNKDSKVFHLIRLMVNNKSVISENIKKYPKKKGLTDLMK